MNKTGFEWETIEIINLSLDLTLVMKKSFKKTNDDLFALRNLSWIHLITLDIKKSPSLKNLSITNWQYLLKYLSQVERNLYNDNQEATYKSIRNTLMKLKDVQMAILHKKLRIKQAGDNHGPTITRSNE